MERKNARLSGYDYSRAGAYFVTVCSRSREPLFWENSGDGAPVGADIIRPQAGDGAPVGATAVRPYAVAHYEAIQGCDHKALRPPFVAERLL